ncbi:hypothetical protein EHV15_35115 [Paenibacillus oralis]|uniref:Uncharacterized protein n=1 Tax=Paenibacillus oralis TaxID=2490856 RepID=A0A3P3TA54_9BACL|nr:hypothetical protein [Paenibacillus oralis]RRJ54822.1 hypothetical protein EHV15_35115 [Paenibacillus oralis]
MNKEKFEDLDNIVRALDLWVELTGVDPAKEYGTFTSREWEIKSVNDELKESLRIDPTKITTMMMLDYFVRDYLENRNFTVQSILDDYRILVDYLEKCRELLDILDSEAVSEAKNEFRDSVIAALTHYGVTNKETFDMANDLHSLAFLRRDALRAIEALECHQFLQGDPDGGRPVYNETVFEFWNINSLIKSMTQTKKSGITLNLIRDPLATSSFFIFAIRNGGTLSILTDRDKQPHPLAKYMSRRPDRSFASRYWRYHFPYDLMGIAMSEDGRSAYIEQQESTALAPYNVQANPLQKIADLNPDETIWIAMMFSQIERKFWKENYKTPQLSYTGEMLKVQHALVAGAAHLPAVMDNYKVLEAPALKSSDVTFEKMKDEWQFVPTGQHYWLEQRYKHLVKDEMLNLVDDGTEIKLLLTGSKRQEDVLKQLKGDYRTIEVGDDKIALIREDVVEQKVWFYDRNAILHSSAKIQAMDSTMFGTAEQVIADQRWVARYNMAKQINWAAHEEYERRKEEVFDWYEQAIVANQENLYKAIVEGQFLAPSMRYKKHGFGYEFTDDENILFRFSKAGDKGKYNSSESTYDTGLRLHNGQEGWASKYYCYINRSKASLYAKFSPTTAAALAKMCGIELGDLPDVLQHWAKEEQYSGNSILDRVDPMEWVVKNPWRDMNFSVCFYLSKSGFIELCKRYGVEPVRFWIDEERKKKENGVV